jgi:3-hydroxyacyl-[acyl-carrier-protein] dehydratase
MHFDLVDRILEQSPDRIVTLKHVTAAEEYLQDHFPSFPVLPGVMMLEAMVQAGRRLLEGRAGRPLVLGKVRALKYGRFVKPGSTLRVEVSLHKDNGDGTFDLRGEAVLRDPSRPAGEPAVAVSGRFLLRPVMVAPATKEPLGCA